MKRRHHSINLIPRDRRAKSFWSSDRALLMGVAAALLIGGWLTFSDWQSLRSLRGQLASTQAQSNRLDRDLASLGPQAVKAGEPDVAQKIRTKNPHWSDMFKELSLMIPHDTWLTEFGVTNDPEGLAISIKGQTLSQANMADFYSALEKSEFFNRVQMVSSEYSDNSQPGTYSFEFGSAAAVAAAAAAKNKQVKK